MEKSVWKHLVILVIIVAATSIATAADAPAAQPTAATVTPAAVDAASKSGTSSFRDWFHNPTDWLSMGADIRFRYTYGWNLDTLNDHPGTKPGDKNNRDSKWEWYQQRMRWWTKTKINDDIDFNLRYTWEFRMWDEPDRKGQEPDFDEIVWDQFNLVVRNLGDMPLTMTVGRQDIRLGEGWLVFDGTPLDAARTIYMDALRFTYKIPDRDTTLDFIWIENRASTDAYLRPISEGHKEVTEQDESGAIIYLTDKTNPNMNLEGYFIYKKDSRVDTPPGVPAKRDPWPASAAAWTKEAEIYTLGGALSGKLAGSEHWKYRTEGAVQFGQKEGVDWTTAGTRTGMHKLMAFGTINKLEYHFNDARKNRVRGVFEYRSGDKQGTGKIEGFDPLWGEYPQFSEISCYIYNLETMIGEVTNMYRLGFGHSMQLTEKIGMDTDIHMLWADENTRQGYTHWSGLGFSDGGKYRGTLATWQLKYALSKNLNGHLLLEYFQPGDYYISSSRDPAMFARVNVDYTF
jgi:hypothetical protein